ncbi:MAG: hypothetical protein ABIO86_07840 [Sphingomonas sp.]
MDRISQTLRQGRVVFHEEVARDGAQGKALLDGAQRARIALAHSAIFADPREMFVFMAGFPSAGHDEFEAVRQVVAEVDTCQIGAAVRLIRRDIDEALRAVGGAAHGRIVLILPVSNAVAQVLTKISPAQALETALGAVRHARDRSPEIAVDVAFLDAGRADFMFVADAAMQLTHAGASTIIACDTVGNMFPSEAEAFFREIRRLAADEAQFIVHMHNDLGFGLVNTLAALKAGIRGLTSSWLGLGERSGMPATEQLLFVLGHQLERINERLCFDGDLWTQSPDLRRIVPLAREISGYVGFGLRTTDPIVGSGVNSISTGTPFSDPLLFSPYDAQAVLGVPQTVQLTALASKPIIQTVARELGFELNGDPLDRALAWVKAQAYARRRAVIEKSDFADWLAANTVPVPVALVDTLAIDGMSV